MVSGRPMCQKYWMMIVNNWGKIEGRVQFQNTVFFQLVCVIVNAAFPKVKNSGILISAIVWGVSNVKIDTSSFNFTLFHDTFIKRTITSGNCSVSARIT